MKYRRAKGFGLVECVIAIAIISIICASTLPLLTSSTTGAGTQTDDYKISMMKNNVLSCFQYADNAEDFKAALNDTINTTSEYTSVNIDASTDAEYKDYDPAKRMVYKNYDYILVNYESNTVAFYKAATELCKFTYSSKAAMQKDIALLDNNCAGDDAMYSKAAGYTMNFSLVFENNEKMNVCFLPGGKLVWESGAKAYLTNMQPFEKDLYLNKIILGYKGYGYSGLTAFTETSDRMCFYFYDITTGQRPSTYISNSGKINTSSYTYLAHISFNTSQTDAVTADTTSTADIYLSSADKYGTSAAKSFDNEYTTLSSLFSYIKYQTDVNSNELKTGLQSGYQYYADTSVYYLNSESNITYAAEEKDESGNTTGFSLYHINDDASESDTLIYQCTDSINENESNVTGQLGFTYDETEKIWYFPYSSANATKVQFDSDNCTAIFYDSNTKKVYEFKYKDSATLETAKNSLTGFKSGEDVLSSGKYSDYYNFNVDYTSNKTISKSVSDSDWASFKNKYGISMAGDTAEITISNLPSDENYSDGRFYDVAIYKKRSSGWISSTTTYCAPAYISAKVQYTLTPKSVTITERTGKLSYNNSNVSYIFSVNYSKEYDITYTITFTITYGSITSDRYSDIDWSGGNPGKGKTVWYGNAKNEQEAKEKITAYLLDKYCKDTLVTSRTEFISKYNELNNSGGTVNGQKYLEQTLTDITAAEESAKAEMGADVWSRSNPYIIENGTKIENAVTLASSASSFLRYYLKGSSAGEHYEVIQNANTIFYAPNTVTFVNPDGARARWKVNTDTVSVQGKKCTYRCIYKEGDYACLITAVFSDVGYKASDAPNIEILPFEYSEIADLSPTSNSDTDKNAYFDAVKAKIVSNGLTGLTYRKG